MNERVSAGALATGKKLSVAELTPMERDALAKEGKISPTGFVDIEEPAAPQVVDLKAEARKKAIKDLNAATSATMGPVSPQAAQEGAASREDGALRKELIRLQEKLEARKNCPRCGLHFEEPYAHEASKEDIQAFLRCVVSASAFAKEYRLFGGELSVTFATRSGAIAEMIHKTVTSQAKRGEVGTEEEVIRAMRQFTMAAALQVYSAGGKELSYTELPTDSVENFAKAAQERINTIPDHIQRFLRPVFGEFNILVDLLTARASDPNFWTGTAK